MNDDVSEMDWVAMETNRNAEMWLDEIEKSDAPEVLKERVRWVENELLTVWGEFYEWKKKKR